MKKTQTDLDETKELAKFLTTIDRMDPHYFSSRSEEIFQQQPFFLSAFLGLRMDVKPEELDEIIKIYFLLWEYFRPNKNVKTIKITQSHFEEVQGRNIEMFKYVQGEINQYHIQDVYSNDLENTKSKSLLALVLLRYNTNPTLSKMDEKNKGVVLIGIKSFIECFEIICSENKTT